MDIREMEYIRMYTPLYLVLTFVVYLFIAGVILGVMARVKEPYHFDDIDLIMCLAWPALVVMTIGMILVLGPVLLVAMIVRGLLRGKATKERPPVSSPDVATSNKEAHDILS